MGKVFNQFLHAGEMINNVIVASNLGSDYNEEKQKQCSRAGYLVICKCGYGYLTRTYYYKKEDSALGSKYSCPYCKRKQKRGE